MGHQKHHISVNQKYELLFISTPNAVVKQGWIIPVNTLIWKGKNGRHTAVAGL